MKIKISNVLILLLGILVFGTILCSNQVKATEVDQAYLTDILNTIPDSMNLDIPEVEYEKAKSIIAENVQKILKDNNIECSIDNTDMFGPELKLKDITYNNNEVSIHIRASQLYLGIEEFHNANIYLYVEDKDTHYNLYREDKDIELIYNNQDKYNANDEKYVKSLKIESPKYFGMDIALFYSSQTWDNIFELIGNYYTNLINDDTIVVKASAGAGGGNEFFSIGTAESGTRIGIFKNGILYEVRVMGCEDIHPLINVPANIVESEMNDFLISEISKYSPEVGKSIVRIEKGATYEGKNVDGGYTAYWYNEENSDFIIVKREEPTDINSQDTTTNIKLETDTSVVPEDTKLVVEKITTGESYNIVVATLGDDIDKFVLYDITLKSNGVEVQPNGKVKISIPIPDGFNKEKLVVYRINEDGTKVKYDVKIETIEGKEYATFETDHFSLYTLALDNETTNTPENSNNNNTLDETPKTGNIDISLYYISAIIVVALAGMVIVKKKNK